jgi:hypothetical protein
MQNWHMTKLECVWGHNTKPSVVVSGAKYHKVCRGETNILWPVYTSDHEVGP